MTKKIVVVGAGFAGLKATRTLSKALKDEVEITLIDRHSYHTMMTQLHEVAAGRVPFTNAQYDLGRLLGKRKNVKLVTDEVINLDKEEKIVKTAHGKYSYDYLIVALGAEPADFGVPGVKENSFTLWSMEDALKIKHHLEEIVMKASTELDPAKRKAMLNISVAGSGFSGIEMMGELIEWRDVTARDWKIDPKDFTLNIVEMLPTILNALDRKQADRAMAYMKKKGVHFLLNHGITAVEKDHISVNVGGRDEEKVAKDIPTYTLIWTTGVQGNTDAQPYGLQETQRGHRLSANEYMEAIGFEDKDIYVAGDVSGFIAKEGGRPQPQIVQAAEQTAHVAAANIIAKIKGTGSKEKVDFKFSGIMVSIGGRYGVAVLGDTINNPKKTPMRLTGIIAMFMKNFIYIIYTLQIGSLWYFFTYLKNEIFNTPDNRNFFRGHTSRRGNALWLFPLRIFYGLAWLLDAIPKIFSPLSSNSSWMGNSVKISTVLKSNGGWIPDPVTTAAGASTSAASNAGLFVKNVSGSESWYTAAKTSDLTAALGKLGIHITSTTPATGITYEYGTVPSAITNGVPQWLQPIMKIFMPNTQTVLFLQKVMSFVELAIGLGLVFGAFTWLAAAGSAGLTIMFASSGMLTWVSLWYIPAAIAIMCGAGRAFGLDKWIQPWIQKHFFHWWYAKPRSIYGQKKVTYR